MVLASVVALLFPGVSATGAGLNTDVALTPPEDGLIVRLQYRYLKSDNDPTPLGREIDKTVNPTTFVYGLTSDTAVLMTVPFVDRDVDFGSGVSGSDRGVGDITLLVKHRFYQEDKPGETTRWAMIYGIEVPSGDDTFSTDSVDPIIGTVWTHQKLGGWLDWDFLYKFNTGGGSDRYDECRVDVAYSHPIVSGQNDSLGPWALYLVTELNGKYITDGSVEVLFSPGLQLMTGRWALEGGAQFPIHQDLKSPRLETDVNLILSTRILF